MKITNKMRTKNNKKYIQTAPGKDAVLYKDDCNIITYMV